MTVQFFWGLTLYLWVLVSKFSKKRSTFIFKGQEIFWDLLNDLQSSEDKNTRFARNVRQHPPNDSATYTRQPISFLNLVLRHKNRAPQRRVWPAITPPLAIHNTGMHSYPTSDSNQRSQIFKEDRHLRSIGHYDLFFHVGPNITISSLFSHTPWLFDLSRARDQILCPNKTTKLL